MTVQGFGVNDADYNVNPTINGRKVMCPAYMAWVSMIGRCYSSKYQEKQPTYIGVTVCDEWRSFMKFREWWLENHVYGWQMDKDLLTDDRQYSPTSCIYVPGWLNTFTNDCGGRRGALMIGVTFEKRIGRFRATCSNPSIGTNERLGCFLTETEAHVAWLRRKLALAKELKDEMDEIDFRIYPRIVEIIQRKSDAETCGSGSCRVKKSRELKKRQEKQQ